METTEYGSSVVFWDGWLEEDSRLQILWVFLSWHIQENSAVFTSSNIQVTLVDSLGFSWRVLWNMWGDMSTKGAESITAAESSPQAIRLHSWRSSSGTHLPCPHSFIHLSLGPLRGSLLSSFAHYSASLSWHRCRGTTLQSTSHHQSIERREEGMRVKKGEWG